MRGSLIGLLLFAACYQPTVRPGVPCSPDQSCPNDQMCINGSCAFSSSPVDGAPDVPPVGVTDRDHDGVLDDRDNCLDAVNVDQADEDGDKVGDACDLCPHVSDSPPKDSDADGVGDACDPGPGATINRRWLFESFRVGPPQWSTANWQPAGDGDSVRVTDPGNRMIDEYLSLPLSSAGRSFNAFTVKVAITIDQIMGNIWPSMGIDVYDKNIDRAVDCELFQNAGNVNNRHLALIDSDDQQLANPTFAWTTGTQYMLTMDVQTNVQGRTTFTCSVVGGGSQQTGNATLDLVARDGLAVQVWGYGVVARVDWLFVAGTAP